MLEPSEEAPLEPDGEERPPLDILYRDERFIAVNKPGGLLVHRSSESRDRVFLLQELRNQIEAHVFPVHRLDRAASGVIVLAPSGDDARDLQDALADESTRKEYLALVRGSSPERGEVDRPLTADNGVKKDARTSFEKIAEFSRCSLLRVRIFTGRRHQIRRHMNHLAHQLIGDSTYGKGKINRFFRDEYDLPRMFLHAAEIDMPSPGASEETPERLTIRAPLAEDLRAFLTRLPDVESDLIDRL